MGWSGGGRAALEFATQYPDRIRSLALVEPAAYWILEQLGNRLEDVERVSSLVHGLFGRLVAEDDLASFLVLAGVVENAQRAPSHPDWNRLLTHRMALSWQGEKLDHPERTVAELAGITCPVLLTKGTRTADWLKQLVDVLVEQLPNASVVELEGDHAHHIQSIDAFLAALESHLTRTV
ncbi:MAG: alpha/beta fold hydrolase [Dermatophilaceae bacterium]